MRHEANKQVKENMKNKKKLFLQSAFLLFLIVGTIIIVRQQRSMPYQKTLASFSERCTT